MKRSTFLGPVALSLLWMGTAPSLFAQQADATTTTTTTITNATGTISQLNYGTTGAVEGLLVGSNILLVFPGNICGGVSTLGAVGNSVTYSGSAVTATSGFETVTVSSFTNSTTKATYTAPSSSSTTTTSTTYGPTSGTVKQLNYGDSGAIDGFLFTAGSTTLFVYTGESASTTLTSLLKAGTTVSVTGATTSALSACSATGSVAAVDAQSLTIGTTTVVISGGGNGGVRGGGPGGGRH